MIEPKYHKLEGLFSDRVFRIPKYQRYYSWGSKQREDLFEDITGLKDKEKDHDHFMATIVCFRTDEVKVVGSREYRLYDIVDGQQRLTTLIILLKAIHQKLEEGEDRTDLGKILVKSDGNLILLQTNNTNQHIFNNFLRDGKTPAKSDLITHADKNLYSGIKECVEFVDSWNGKNREVLNLLRIIRNRLGFVVYDTNDSRVVYSVFEVLNSRGLAVDWLDKSKSSLMGLSYELSKTTEAQEAYITQLNDLWGKIYQEISTYPIPGHEILRVTATLYTGTESGKPQKAETALTSLKDSCTSSDDTIKVSNWIYNVTKKLVQLQSNVHLGPVTNVLQARLLAASILLTDSLSDNERNKALKQWEKVTFRIYGIFGKDSRSKVGDFVRLANKIMNKTVGASRYSEIMKSIRRLGSEYPVEEAINEGLKGKNVYEGNQDTVRYILWRYEEHLSYEAGKGAIVNEEFKKEIWEARSGNESVEHIMPQNPESGGAWDGKIDPSHEIDEVVHRIGNLILLPKPLNNEAKRQGFLAKKSIYAKSEGLRMVKEVIDKSDWSEREIEKREAKILDWVKNEWQDIDD